MSIRFISPRQFSLPIKVLCGDKEHISNKNYIRLVNRVAIGGYISIHIHNLDFDNVFHLYVARKCECDKYLTHSLKGRPLDYPFPLYLVFKDISSLVKYKLNN